MGIERDKKEKAKKIERRLKTDLHDQGGKWWNKMKEAEKDDEGEKEWTEAESEYETDEEDKKEKWLTKKEKDKIKKEPAEDNKWLVHLIKNLVEIQKNEDIESCSTTVCQALSAHHHITRPLPKAKKRRPNDGHSAPYQLQCVIPRQQLRRRQGLCPEPAVYLHDLCDASPPSTPPSQKFLLRCLRPSF